MKHDFENVYRYEIAPLIQDLNQKRRLLNLLKKMMFTSILLFFVLFALGIFFQVKAMGIFLVILFVCLLASGIAFSVNNNRYRKLYKRSVTQKLVQAIDPSLSYQTKKNIINIVKDSKLFKQLEKVDCDDVLEGVCDEHRIAIYDAHGYYTTGNSDDRTTYTVFKGILITLSISNRNGLDVQFIPKKAGSNLTSFVGKFLNSENIIHSRNPQIQNSYHIKGFNNDPFLFSKLEQYISEQEELPYVSICGDMAYFAFPSKKNHFDMPKNKELTKGKVELVWNELSYYLQLTKQLSDLL